MNSVSVVIPTLNRPVALRRALESLRRQTLPTGISVDIIVVDNSSDGNARTTIQEVASTEFPVRYTTEPEAGVSNARNAGIREARGDWVAFLDDDEEAAPGWLASLLEIAARTKSAAVFGPVEAKSEKAELIQELGPYFSRRIDRAEASDITDLVAYLGTNNSMFDRGRCLQGERPFDPALNTSGGEDSLLLKRLVLAGVRFAWAPGALVTEWVPPRRLSWAYVRKRKFLSGQIRIFVLHMLRPIRWLEIVGWMGIGLVQFLVGGAAALILWPLHSRKHSRALVMCFAGLGKVFWMPRFRRALYGAGLIS